jgi:cbb3-type cytochrome oxidase subunit 3
MEFIFAGIITGAIKTVFWAGALFAILVIGGLYFLLRKKK